MECFRAGNSCPCDGPELFQPPDEALLRKLNAKDRRFTKKWEYIKEDGVWMDMGVSTMLVVTEGNGGHEEFGSMMALSESSFTAALEVLSIKENYFSDLGNQEVEAARKISFLVEQGNCAVFSESNSAASETRIEKVEMEAVRNW